MSSMVDLVKVRDFPYDFWIGKNQVSMAEYRCFLEDTGWRHPRTWPTRAFEHESRLPVSWVNHFDANAYCFWLSQTTGRAYSLSSTEMLQAAARSTEAINRLKAETEEAMTRIPPSPRGLHFQLILGDQVAKSLQRRIFSTFPWGEQPDPRRCNCKEYRPHRPGPTPFDQFADKGASHYGVMDLSGNLWEMSSTFKTEAGDVTSAFGTFFDAQGPYPDFLHFLGGWGATLRNVSGNLEKSPFAWDLRADLLGGSYGTAAADCRTDAAGAWTSWANLGPYAGFRVASLRHG